jgi:hypothetical protein
MSTPLAIPGMSQDNIARLRLLHNISVVRKRRVVSPLSGLSFTPPQEVPFTNGMPSNGYWGGTNCVDTLHITGLDEDNDEITIKCPVFSSDQINLLAALISEINNGNAQQPLSPR